jgi:GntR family transcriptional regulator
MDFQVHITTGGSTPIYRQIVDQVRRAVATGAWPPAMQLPSVRGLAEQLVVNPNTVARAYLELVRDGLLASQPGRGLFVVANPPALTKAQRLARLQPALDALLSAASAAGASADDICAALDKKLEQWDTNNPDTEAAP